MFSSLKHFAIVTVLALCALARVSTQLVPGYYLISPNTEAASVLMGAVIYADEDAPTPVVGLPRSRVSPLLSLVSPYRRITVSCPGILGRLGHRARLRKQRRRVVLHALQRRDLFHGRSHRVRRS